VFLNDPNLGSENGALLLDHHNPVNALKRSCVTSCAALPVNINRLTIENISYMI